MSAGAAPAPAPVDLSWGESFVDGFPHDFFTWLRREHPVWWHDATPHTPDGEGFWVVSRYAEAAAIMKDPVTFSSALGGTAINDSAGSGILLNQTDDPQHRRLRALVSRGFTPRTIGRLEDDLRERAVRILDAVPLDEPFDFVAAVAQELPLQAICSVLGVPQEDRRDLARIVSDAVDAGTGEVLGSDYVRLLGSYGSELIRTKREHPADDILSIIVHARDDDGSPPLSDREVKAFFNLLFPAGAETTRSAIGGAVVAFVQHPDQLARLRDDPALIRPAIEEIVRWTSPSVYKRRTATRDVDLAGRRVAKGQKVTYWEMSANRDETVFADPFRFDVGRDPNPHVGFGLGTHFCLGASLARLEIRIMIEQLSTRFDFELAGRPVWPRNNRLVGMTQLPLVAHRRPRPGTDRSNG
jgi:cytochrome P450